MNLLDRFGLRGRALLARCYLLLLLLIAARLVWRPYISWDDFWGHAAVGRWIWQNYQPPSHTLFLWSASQTWVAHSWLFQLIMFGLLTADGGGPKFYFLHVCCWVLVALPVLLLWRLWRRQGDGLGCPVLLFLLALLCGCHRFTPRAELFTGLCLAVLLTYLVRWSVPPRGEERQPSSRGQTLGAVGLVLLFIVWANLHGAVAHGLLILGSTCLADLLQERFDRRSRRLALLGLLCVGAICVNPYGLRYWETYRFVGNQAAAQLEEWRPVWQSPAIPWHYLLGIAVLPVLALVAAALNPGRRWSHFAWIVLTTGSYLYARRQAWLLCIVSLAVLAANAGVLESERLRAVGRRLLRRRGAAAPGRSSAWAVLGHAGVFVAALVLFANADLLVPVPPPDMPRAPAGVARFLDERHLPGRMFNDYDNSGYLEWRLAGQYRFYIDMVNDSYPGYLLPEYASILMDREDGRALLDRYEIGYVVLTRPSSEARQLGRFVRDLSADPRWVRVYARKDGVVFVRRTPEYQSVWQAGPSD